MLNQLTVIIFLGFMAYNGHYIENNYIAHFLSLSLLFFDAMYISYKNVKCNKVLNHFSLLLLLLGWQFLLYLFAFLPIAKAVSMLFLPVCFYQSAYFIQAFLFQGSAYRGKKVLFVFLKISCAAAMICYFISDRAFFAAYQLQFIISMLTLVAVGVMQRKRIAFVLKSQWKRLLFPLALVVIPFVIYLFVFHREAEYMASMGSYIPVMLAFVCIHSIVFQYHPKQAQFLTLSWEYIAALVFVGLVGLIGTAYLFQIPLMAILMSVHIVVLLALFYNVLLYVRICRQPTDYNNPTDRQHFYAYSLEQIKREENLKKEFSNYLHDDILQDLLSVKNMIRKAEQPEIRQLLLDTLTELNASIRFQMQTYHPNLIKSLTLKENIQNLLDTLGENHSAKIHLDCNNDIFLVEPYNVLLYRMMKELVTNALKHSSATIISVLLIQEDGRITLKVTDNGIGFKPFTYQVGSHQGLASIGEQVSLLNGTMNIQPAVGGGTAVVIFMPMNGGDSYESFVGR
ncbi:MAG: ATP-binding protein [Anaerotignum sp.]|nr:ATP-binding protein [Anaerotignum sp.]